MDAITIRAGPRALAAIREGGLRAADVAIVPGAAGGPKALGLHGLDVALFGEWFPKAPRVRHLIGASIGAWRFAAACRPDPVQGLRELARLYAGQRFPPRPAATLVSRKVREMLAELFDGHDADILGDPGYRLHILVVRGRGLLARDAGIRRTFGFGAAAVANLAGRRHLRHFLERTVFHDARERPSFLDEAAISGDLLPASGAAPIRFDAFRTHAVALERDNLREALVASAAIPMVIEACPTSRARVGHLLGRRAHRLPPAPAVLALRRARSLPALHRSHRAGVDGQGAAVAAGARGVARQRAARVAVARVPREAAPRKLPDRSDFRRFESDYDARLACWRTAIAESARLGDAFLAFAERPDPSASCPSEGWRAPSFQHEVEGAPDARPLLRLRADDACRLLRRRADGVDPLLVPEALLESGARMIAASSACRRLTASGGVFAGTTIAIQTGASKPGNPDSATVGTSPTSGERVAPVCATTRILPVRTCGMSAVGLSDRS